MIVQPGEITGLLSESREGNELASRRLMEFVYDELRKLAGEQMRRERAGHTLQPTALVHEAFLKLVRNQDLNCRDRSHFFAVASIMMRRILIDHARAHRAGKRGFGQKIELFDKAGEAQAMQSAALLDLDRALDKLAAMDARLSRLVELHYFGGLTFEEAAEILNISTRTAKRDWTIAKAWLRAEMENGGHGTAGSMARN